MGLPARYDITHYQGDTFSIVVALDGNFLASTFKFELKIPNAVSPALELTNGSGITIGGYNPTTGKTPITITITPVQSTALGSSIYWYDLEDNTGGVIKTYLAGTFAQVEQISV